MMEWVQSHPDLYSWVILPLLILIARVIDVSLGTARVIFVSRGYKFLAAAAGFWEVLIWLLAIRQIMQNLSNPICYIAYAAGFATGNIIGISLTEKMSLGVVLVRILTNQNPQLIIESLKNGKYGVTSMDGQGAFGPTKLIFTIVQRQSVEDIISIIKMHAPKAFYSIEEVSRVRKDKIAPRKFPGGLSFLKTFMPFRKGK